MLLGQTLRLITVAKILETPA